jgi:hypothetical protein
MKHLDKFELHDAVIQRTTIDYPKKTVQIEIVYYPEPVHAKTRRNASILFEGVRCISHSGDFTHLADNAWAGNINYWVPASKSGVTFIYLVEGAISIDARTVSVKVKRCRLTPQSRGTRARAARAPHCER